MSPSANRRGVSGRCLERPGFGVGEAGNGSILSCILPLASLLGAPFDHSSIASHLSHQMQKFHHPRFVWCDASVVFFQCDDFDFKQDHDFACRTDLYVNTRFVGRVCVVAGWFPCNPSRFTALARFRSNLGFHEFQTRVDPMMTVGWRRPETNPISKSIDPCWIGRNVGADLVETTPW